MPGLGTIINVAAIVVGGFIGLLFGKFMKPRFQDTLMKSCGVCVIFVGITGVLTKMLTVENGKIFADGTLMMISCLAIGSIVGEIINFEMLFEKFGEWLKNKTGNRKETFFVNAFVNASFTVCIGAMAIVGAIEDGINRDISTLILKAILDMLIICIMTSSIGKGCIFSAIPVGILQGSVTALSGLIKPLLTEPALNNLSLLGSVLIFCVGVNLVFEKIFKVANMLPSVIVAVIWGLVLPA
ncbi:MAG: DUF554 domain-containing protein [Oscillospiraceae bacterium]|nr:DUF554 domain-containing protein [Oscillospiraceae bacterium]